VELFKGRIGYIIEEVKPSKEEPDILICDGHSPL